MSLYLGNNLVAGIPDVSGKANTNLDNLSASGQAIIDGKADISLSNTVVQSSFANNLNTAGIRTVVTTYISGANWYRVWSDGWIEQGGKNTNASGNNPTCTLVKAFSDTNYTLMVMGWTSLTGGAYYAPGIYNKTVSTFKLYATHSTTVEWYACGY